MKANTLVERLSKPRTAIAVLAPAMSSWTQRQIALIHPSVICPMGNSAIHALVNSDDPVTDVHGIPFEVGGMTYFPLYHPAAALYTFSLREVMLEDFRKLRALLDSAVD